MATQVQTKADYDRLTVLVKQDFDTQARYVRGRTLQRRRGDASVTAAARGDHPGRTRR